MVTGKAFTPDVWPCSRAEGPGREGRKTAGPPLSRWHPGAAASRNLGPTHPVNTRQSRVQKRMSTWLNMADCVRRIARWKSF